IDLIADAEAGRRRLGVVLGGAVLHRPRLPPENAGTLLAFGDLDGFDRVYRSLAGERRFTEDVELDLVAHPLAEDVLLVAGQGSHTVEGGAFPMTKGELPRAAGEVELPRLHERRAGGGRGEAGRQRGEAENGGGQHGRRGTLFLVHGHFSTT